MELNTVSTEVLNQLKSLYGKNQYSEGLELLKSNKESFEPGLYHYNVGTVNAKLKNYSQARFHLELARTKNFNPSLVDNNLKFLKNELGLTRLETPQNFFEYVQDLSTQLSRDAVIIFGLIFIILSILTLRKSKSLVLSLVLILISIIPLSMKYYSSNVLVSGIIKNNVVLQSGPSELFEPAGEAPAGLKIYIKEFRKEWLFIKYPEGFQGWISKKSVNLLRNL